MGIEQIVTKIIDEARGKAATVRLDFDGKADEMAHRWAEEQKLRKSDHNTAVSSATAKERERLIITEKLEGRKRRLALRRELVDSVFEKVRRDFLELDEKTYLPLLAKLIASATETGDEEVVLSSKDLSQLGKDAVDLANELVEQQGLEAGLTLAASAGKLDAGAILRRERVETRRTLDELLLEVRELLEGRVASMLFEDEA